MRIWVDADACPRVIKDILYRAAQRTGIQLILVANSFLKIPKSEHIRFVQVPAGFDAADDYICKQVELKDLVITADLPLAAEVMEKAAFALNPRGELYTDDSIKQKLAMRDFMDTMRASGEMSGGPSALSQKDRKAFADSLDKVIQRSKGNH